MVGPARRRALLALGILWSAAAPVLPQRTAASVHGTVTDATGAVLPGATVTLTGVDTGFRRSVSTNGAGVYLFGDLQVGSFEIRVELDGFKTAVVTAVELSVAEVRQIDVVLELGAVSDEITAVAEAMPLEQSQGELAGLITGDEIRELPLNGRNFTQLTQLMPGVTTLDSNSFTNKGLMSNVLMSISGGGVTGNLWTVDGVANNDPSGSILVYPSVDAIEEFKIHSNSYSAEFGGASAAQINLVTRGGSNRLRASAYLFFRHDSLNEKNHFLELSGGEQEALDRKDFGFTLGGPIRRDRLHFFVSQEWNAETRGTVRSALVPTAAERRGDFSSSIPGCGATPIDPLTGEPFPGNVIPADRISPGGQAYLGLYSLPNVAPASGTCSNWVDVVPSAIDWQQTSVRLDWSASARAQVLLRYTRDDWDNPAPNAGASSGLWGDDPFPVVDSSWDQPSTSVLLRLTNVIGSSAVNSLSFSYSGNEVSLGRGGENAALNDEINARIPPFFPAGEKTTGAERGHPLYFGGATGDTLGHIAPWANELEILALRDDYQQVFGEHWLKAGVLVSDNSKLEFVGSESPQFWGGVGVGGWGATTGNRIADILLEDMMHGYQETASLAVPVLEWQDVEVYLADTWRPHPRLTVNAGVRYSFFEPTYARDDDFAAFYPSLWNPVLGSDACNGMAQVPGTDPCGEAGLLGGGEAVSRSLVHSDTDNFAPRVGLAWDVSGTGDRVLRAGFGQFYQRERVGIHLGLVNQPPFTRNTNGIRPLDEPGGPFLLQGFGVPNRGIDPNNQTPYSLQFNLTWEQRFGPGTTLEVSYVGSRGRHLARRSDVNQVPRGDANGNGTSDRLEFIRGNGQPPDPVRPYFTGARDWIVYWENDGQSEYDALQTQLVTRFGRGSQAQVSYTWSRLKANGSLADPGTGPNPVLITDREDPALDWGYAGLHRDHVFNASVLWNLPAFESRGGALRALLGDWAVGGILIYATGAPLTVYNGAVPGLPDGQVYGTGFTFNQRPMRVPGVPCEGSGLQVIDPEAFTLNGLRLGDVSQGAGRGVCEGPDFFQIDLSLYKQFRITDRLSGQFRIEIFNVLDEVNLIGESVDATLDPFDVVLDAPLSQASQILSAQIPAGFGRAQAARDPRQIQLGIKLFF